MQDNEDEDVKRFNLERTRLTQEDIERLICGFLLREPTESAVDASAYEKIVDAGITASWFDNAATGGLLADLMNRRATLGRYPTPDDMFSYAISKNRDLNEASNYKTELVACRAKLLVRDIAIESVIDRMRTHYLGRSVQGICERGAKNVSDPAIGAAKTIEEMSEAILRLKKSLGAPSGFTLPPSENMSEHLGEKKRTPNKEILYGFLYKGGKMILGAPSKGKKSYNLIALSACVAAGRPWLGICSSVSKVLFLNFELFPFEFEERLERIVDALKLPPETTKNIEAIHLRGLSAPIQDMADAIIRRTKQSNVDLLIVDPCYKSYGGLDENSASDMALYCNSLERIANECDAAIAIAHHFAKGNSSSKDAFDRISGSGVLWRDPDAMAVFSPHAVDDAFTVSLGVRSFPIRKEFVVKWDYPVFRIAPDLDPEQLKQPLKAPKGAAVTLEDILECCSETPRPVNEVIDMVKGETEAGENRIRSILKRAVQDGYLEQSERKRSGARGELLVALTEKAKKV